MQTQGENYPMSITELMELESEYSIKAYILIKADPREIPSSMLAISMGRDAFFDPETLTLPLKGLPPSTKKASEVYNMVFFIFVYYYLYHIALLGVKNLNSIILFFVYCRLFRIYNHNPFFLFHYQRKISHILTTTQVSASFTPSKECILFITSLPSSS